MLYYSVVFLVLALIAAAFGLSDTPTVADTLSWFGFSVFLALAIAAAWRWRSNRHNG